MIRFRWFHNLLGVSPSRKDRRRLTARKRKTVRLMLESLEERLTPSGGNATVTQTAGSFTALTQAVAADTATNTNYVLEITQGFQFNAGGQVAISKLAAGSNLTIEGQNGVNQTLTGNGNRLFTIAKGQTVTFEDLTLTGGKVTNTVRSGAGGGALLDQGGNVTLSNVTVSGNTVTGGSASGGGIYASGGPVTGSSATLAIKGGSTIQSNHATATGGNASLGGGMMFSNSASGGGLFVAGIAGTITVTISDSTISNNSATGATGANATTAGAAGAFGGSASGGGMDVIGSAWNATLMGDTFSGNSVIGGAGGNGADGSPNANGGTGGSGGSGGFGGIVSGAAAAFNGNGNCNLTILNDLSAPTPHPSLVIDNSAQAGAAGNGGNGGVSSGTASNSTGGQSGFAGEVLGGALDVSIAPTETTGTATIDIGNTTIYGNKSTGGVGGTGGAAGTGGSGTAGEPGHVNSGGVVAGGGLAVSYNDSSTFNIAFTLFNSTVASNIATGGASAGGAGPSLGAGIFISLVSTNANSTLNLYNDTITQNLNRGSIGTGAGVDLVFSSSPPPGSPPAPSSIPALYNNLIQGNMSGSSEDDLAAGGATLSNATNNFITAASTNAVSTSTNTIDNNTPQLAGVVGVSPQGNPTSGPVYYPLLTGVVSIGAGTTGNNVLSTIASLEGTTPANATDEIGNPRLTNGKINLGAVQSVSNSPPPAPSPSPSPGPAPSPSPAPSPPTPPPPNAPPLLAFLDQILGGTVTVNADGSETVTDSLFGIPLITVAFDAQGHLVSVNFFGINITFLFLS